jgi:hypothetical protein
VIAFPGADWGMVAGTAHTRPSLKPAFQPHFAPGLHGLFIQPPPVVRAEVRLAVRRDPGYFRGWRRTYANAGGVLHQQAIHGLAMALRLMPGQVETVDATAVHRRGLAETEDHVTADIRLTGGKTMHIDARVDHQGPPRHELVCTSPRGDACWCAVGTSKPGSVSQTLLRRMSSCGAGCTRPCSTPPKGVFIPACSRCPRCGARWR